ncbi:chorismate synthase [Methanococcus voltae]|uniref:Chorismate synthase n=1 Tax=Methanococcus voltae TaxID=2188 RepID=A0A8J7UQQ9_METVO|nr:chorismate synthase [Methanococcus voltae]MBP2201043.1 chorismate synthase [Methanococcus voltae]
MNTYGNLFRVTVWGESHGKALGAVIDGCPSNLELSEYDIQKELNRRRPGYSIFSTPRKEEDKIELLSGIFEGKTTGTPISAVVYNTNQKSKDYSALKDMPRPGHADLNYLLKYGNYDYRGGGRTSGRTTIGHVIGGAIAKKLLTREKIIVFGHSVKIGKIKGDITYYDNLYKNLNNTNDNTKDTDSNNINNNNYIDKIINDLDNNPLRTLSNNYKDMEKYVLNAMDNNDSVGGVVELIVLNLPQGIGEPLFNKLNARISEALMSINAVKGVEIGRGFEVSELYGSENNDEYYYKSTENNENDNQINYKSNNCGGVIAGISTGTPIVVRVAIKPTPSIFKVQDTINLKTKTNAKLKIEGRHDPIIVPRVIPVLESMISIVLVDLLKEANKI